MSSLQKDIEALAHSVGTSLYDIEVRRDGDSSIYCVMIQKEGGVTLDDCAHLSRLISPLMDINPPVSGNYYLEVSSPGIERKLKTQEHFERSIGEKVSVTTKANEKFKGVLEAFSNGCATVDGQTVKFSDISRARTVF